MKLFTLNPKRYHPNFSRGFTLIEMLVSITIITVITSVVFLQSSQFNSSILLSNIAYELAISIREAQSYGLSVRGLGTDEISLAQSELRFRRGYGVILKGDDAGTPLDTMTLFADTYPLEEETGDKLFTDAGSSNKDTTISNLNLKKGYTITNFCLISNGGRFCYVPGLGESPLVSKQLVIYFLRPYPEASIHDNTISGLSNLALSAEITVTSPDKTTSKVVKVYQTGQIEVVSGVIKNTI